jgi:hypothetical protein
VIRDGTSAAPRGMRIGALVAAATITGLVPLNGCGQSVCNCTFNFVRFEVPAATAATVTRSGVSGAGCEARCYTEDFREVEAGAPQRCENYTVSKREPGTCHFAIDFKDGKMFARDVAFVAKGTKDCCGGVYPENDANVVVSPP